MRDEVKVDKAEPVILIGLGANISGPGGVAPLETCRAAVRDLASLPGLRLAGVSPWYRSAAIPPSDQPLYINGVAKLLGAADPAALLRSLHDIEARAGRTRTTPNAARTLDLDLIAMGNLIRAADPILPHPRAHLRAFVLRPLADVAPGWVHPVLGRTAGALLADLPPQAIELFALAS